MYNNLIIEETSSGSSYIIGNDEKTSTYKYGEVTDDTTEEQDLKYVGQIRTAQQSENKKKDSLNSYVIILLILIFIFIKLISILKNN